MKALAFNRMPGLLHFGSRVANVGSPRLPPGGGLQSLAARKPARPLGCGVTASKIDRAAIGGTQPPGGGGPQLLCVIAPSAGCAPNSIILNLEF